MDKKICKAGMCILGAQFLVGSAFIPIENTYYTSFAEERVNGASQYSTSSRIADVVGEAVSAYGLGKTYNSGFASYLNKKGISNREYESYVSGTNKYTGSNVEKAEKIENLTYIFDISLYTHPIVKSIYNWNVSTYKNKDTSWTNFKKGAIYDEDWLADIFYESLDGLDMIKAYKYLFKKVPTATIEKDLNSKGTIKYGLYSGVLKRELTKDERDKIKNGLGYDLLGVSKAEYKAYQSYRKLKEKIVKKEIMYIKETLIHSEVRDKIKRKTGKDIYSKLSDNERLYVYNMSLNNFNYDKSKAEKAFMLLLERKEEMDSGKPIESPKEDSGISDGAVLNPVGKEENPIKVPGNTLDDYEYLDKVQPDYGIFGPDFEIIPQSSKTVYTAQYYYDGKNIAETQELEDKFYVIQVGEELIPTRVKVEEKITDEVLLKILKAATEKEHKWRVITSRNEHLVFINNKIITLEIKEEYSLKDLNKELAELNVGIVKMSKEDIQKIEDEKSKEEGAEKDE